jgi:hypothetical protein
MAKKKSKFQEQKEKVTSMVKTLEKMTDEQKEQLLKQFPILRVSTQTPYSHYNTLLLIKQMQDRKSVYTLVGGYNDWKKHGRQVKEGEVGNGIFKPIPSKYKKKMKDGSEKTELLGCFLAPVWDITQTDPLEEVTEK